MGLVACGGGRSEPSRSSTSGDEDAQRHGEIILTDSHDGADVAYGQRVQEESATTIATGSTAAAESPPPAPPQSVQPSAEPVMDQTMSLSVESTGGLGGGAVIMPPNMGGSIVRERSPLDLMGYAVAPSVPTRVLLGTLELPPGERFVPAVSSCQDTLIYVASGTLEASGTGIASVDAPATLYVGDAVRFGPEGDGLIVNTSSEPVRTIVALARSEDGGPARVALEERGDRTLCPARGTSDPLSQPQRLASFATSPPLVVMDGSLEVRILLDADGSSAQHAGLAVLTGSPGFAVPEHVHDEAAEILYFEEGRGTMHIGEHDVAVAPGVSVYVPEGTPHSFEPSGSSAMRALQFYAPSGPEQRFRGMTGS